MAQSCSISSVLAFFVGNGSRDDPKCRVIQNQCRALFEADYEVAAVPNSHGDLCAHYPLEVLVLLRERGAPRRVNDAAALGPAFAAARFARTRSRFAAPVILMGTTNVCRSATLARSVEIKTREAHRMMNALLYGDAASHGAAAVDGDKTPLARSTDAAFFPHGSTATATVAITTSLSTARSPDTVSPSPVEDTTVTARHRCLDVALLRLMGVHYICDLMVEDRKIKLGLAVTSSEKADRRNRYTDFVIASTPFDDNYHSDVLGANYPGVEVFRGYRRKHYRADRVAYDWNGVEVDAQFSVPSHVGRGLGIDWRKYRTWDIVLLTQNYLKLYLHFLQTAELEPAPYADGPSCHGLLVHCISGWDRTPLFVSLLRLSLWADGRVHQSLSPAEILFLTVAYDWLLFGHLLHTRLSSDEEIFRFCFDFLQFICGDEFALPSAKPASAAAAPANPVPLVPNASPDARPVSATPVPPPLLPPVPVPLPPPSLVAAALPRSIPGRQVPTAGAAPDTAGSWQMLSGLECKLSVSSLSSGSSVEAPPPPRLLGPPPDSESPDSEHVMSWVVADASEADSDLDERSFPGAGARVVVPSSKGDEGGGEGWGVDHGRGGGSSTAARAVRGEPEPPPVVAQASAAGDSTSVPWEVRAVPGSRRERLMAVRGLFLPVYGHCLEQRSAAGVWGWLFNNSSKQAGGVS